MSDLLDASTVDADARRRQGSSSSATVAPRFWGGSSVSTTAIQPAVPSVDVQVRESDGVYQVTRIHVTQDPGGRGRSDQLESFVNQINEFLRTCPDDDDEPTSPDVARRVIERLAILVLHDTRVPELYTLADGGLLVRWINGDERSLEIEFDADGDDLAMITERHYGEVARENGYLQQMWPAAMRWLFSA